MKPLYMARAAYPLLSFAIGRLARKVTRWSVADDRALRRLYEFLEHNSELKLRGRLDSSRLKHLRIQVFPDADLAADIHTAKSTSGMWLRLTDGENHWPLEWQSKLQTAVSHSTPEAELVSMARALRKFALPVQGLLQEVLDMTIPIEVYEDNTATIQIVGAGYSAEMGHLSRTHRISLAWTADVCALPDVHLSHCPTADQLGDSFTKALDKHKFQDAQNKLGMG